MGKLHFMLIINGFSRMMWVYFLGEKYEAFEKFKDFKAMVENEIDIKIKIIRPDNGGPLSENNLTNFVRSMTSKGSSL